ncbi:MAG: TIGR01777 family oxidoreductase [Candidatus Sulfotelmatobacter sp.]
MNSKVLVSGASGLIGSALVPTLKSSGWTVVSLVRAHSANRSNGEQIVWDPSQPLAPESVSGLDAVIHLAGETIMGRWSSGKKKKIMDSRVMGTMNLSQALARAEEKPKVLISGSAIGYYGDRGDEALTEASAPGTGFLAEVTEKWEEATTPAVRADIRTAHIRTGIVLSSQGGALEAMLLPFKLGLGGRTGSGQQWMSWIDVQDMVGAIHHILKNDLIQGAVNLVAPKPVRNAEFAKTLASVLSRPAIFPMPAFAVKAIFGEMGDALLLGSQKVEPGKLISSGYPFRYRDLRASLHGLLNK